MAETLRSPQYNKDLMKNQIAMLRNNLVILENRRTELQTDGNNALVVEEPTIEPVIQEIKPVVEEQIVEPVVEPIVEPIVEPVVEEVQPIVDVPAEEIQEVEEVQQVEEVRQLKGKKKYKSNSAKNKIVTSPTLLVNNIRIALLERRIAREKRLNEEYEQEEQNKQGIISKITSAGSFLVSLPKKACLKIAFKALGENFQEKYGERYFNHLEKIREKERQEGIELAEKLEEEYIKAKRKQDIEDMLFALKEQDREILAAKKAELDDLIYEPEEVEEIQEAEEIEAVEAVEEELDEGGLRR